MSIKMSLPQRMPSKCLYPTHPTSCWLSMSPLHPCAWRCACPPLPAVLGLCPTWLSSLTLRPGPAPLALLPFLGPPKTPARGHPPDYSQSCSLPLPIVSTLKLYLRLACCCLVPDDRLSPPIHTCHLHLLCHRMLLDTLLLTTFKLIKVPTDSARVPLPF